MKMARTLKHYSESASDGGVSLAPQAQTVIPKASDSSRQPQTAETPIAAMLNPMRKPTYLEVFLGQAVDMLSGLQQARAMVDELLRAINKPVDKDMEAVKDERSKLTEELTAAREAFSMALASYRLTPKMIWTYQWSLLFSLVLTGLIQVFFIEIYCRWHGSYFISLDLYNPVNVGILSKISFVNGATTMSVTAEVMMWSSLGVWAQQSYVNTMAMVQRKFRFVDDSLSYAGIMMRTCSIAAIVVIVLRLTKFAVFGVSLDESSPLAFDATIGLSFLLGFFGNDAYRILAHFKDKLLKNVTSDKDED
jgi:hypothetical protein